MTVNKIIELLQAERECVIRNSHDSCNRDCLNCDLCQDDFDLIEMYDFLIDSYKSKREEYRYCPKCGLDYVWQRRCPRCGANMKGAKYMNIELEEA